MTWDQYHKLYGDIYRLHKKYKAEAAGTLDADMLVESQRIWEKYGGGDGFALGLIEAVMKDLLAEPDKGWSIVIKNPALF